MQIFRIDLFEFNGTFSTKQTILCLQKGCYSYKIETREKVQTTSNQWFSRHLRKLGKCAKLQAELRVPSL